MKRRAQLPNPPAVFVGRSRSLAWLLQAIERGPVVLITAPQGLGKTTLVRKALHDHTSPAVKTSKICVVDAGQQTTHEVRMEVLRVVAAASPRSKVDLRALQADPEQAMLKALELAERRGLWTVIDGLDAQDIEESQELLTLLASYAKTSRWIVTGRPAFRVPLLAGQTHRLETMDPEVMRTLALSWAPGIGPRELAASLTAAAGSPFQLSRALASGGAGDGVDWLTRGLSQEAFGFLRVLSLVETPLPLEVLFQLAPDPGEEVRDALERRGLLLRGALGFTVHSIVKGAMAGWRLEAGGWREMIDRAAVVLAAAPLPEATIEAARLWLDAGELDRVVALLDEHAQHLFSQGYAPSLWRLLRTVSGPRFHALRLKCAAELGNPTALAEVHDTFDGTRDQLVWAETLAARGANTQALAQLAPLLDALDPNLSDRAALLSAEVLRRLGRFDEALRTLAGLQRSFERDARRLASLVGKGQLDGAKQELSRLAHEILSSSDEATDSIMLALAETAITLGSRDHADQCLAWIAQSPRGAEDALLSTRRAQILQARLELGGLEIDRAQQRVDRLRPFARGPSFLRPWIEVIELGCRLAQGELEGWERRADALSKEFDAACAAELEALKTRLSALSGQPPSMESEEWSTTSGLAAARVKAWHALHCARHGLEPITEVTRGTAELTVLDALRRSTQLIVAGCSAEAMETLGAAEHEARRHELSQLLLEAMVLRCDAAICLGELGAWHQSIEAVRKEPKLVACPRLAQDVEIHRALAHDGCPQASLEVLATQIHNTPVAARRARALLGGNVPLDEVDLRVLESVAARGYRYPQLVLQGGASEWGETGWGLDPLQTTIWLPNRVVDLSSKRLLWQLLMALVEAGGALDKERLICTVWEESDYHPLRHDGRMHTAVRKLRAELEDDPKSPTRFITTEDGYSLVGPVRLIPQG